jgi:hypothetical protein
MEMTVLTIRLSEQDHLEQDHLEPDHLKQDRIASISLVREAVLARGATLRSVDSEMRRRSASAREWSAMPVQARSTSASWELTDRGIAVVMVIAAMILTAAIAVISLTAVRVTSGEYGAGLPESHQARR